MDLWDAVREIRCSSLAVFGMAKNAGKTVALNHLAQSASRAGIVLGLTSIGRDGEMWDVLTHRRKPLIRVERGVFLATAEACLEAGTAVLEILETTAIATPLGPVCVARVDRPGRVEVAGPGRSEQLLRIVKRLRKLGARLVLVDGAIDRRSLASPRVTEACVLAAGAILSETMEDAVRLIQERVRQLTLPRATESARHQWQQGRIVASAGERTRGVAGSDALEGKAGLRAWIGDEEAAVLVGGALTEALLRDLMGARVRVVVRDPTCLFVDGELLGRFERQGGRVEVIDPLRLAAVTVNPVSPEGWSFDAVAFYGALRNALPGLPVFDVKAGLAPRGGNCDKLGTSRS